MHIGGLPLQIPCGPAATDPLVAGCCLTWADRKTRTKSDQLNQVGDQLYCIYPRFELTHNLRPNNCP